MLEKKMLFVLVGALLVVIGVVVWGIRDGKNQPSDDQSAVVLYVGDGCPHCQVVEDFLAQNVDALAGKAPYEQKEVWKNVTNAQELGRRATACRIAQDTVGVPFLYAAGKCLVGETDVIGYFKEKAGLGAGQP